MNITHEYAYYRHLSDRFWHICDYDQEGYTQLKQAARLKKDIGMIDRIVLFQLPDTSTWLLGA